MVARQSGSLADMAFLWLVLCQPIQFLAYDTSRQRRACNFQRPSRLANGALFHLLHCVPAAVRLYGRSHWTSQNADLGSYDLRGRKSYLQLGLNLYHALHGASCQRFRPGHGLDVGTQAHRELVSSFTTSNGNWVFCDVCSRRQQFWNLDFRIAWRSTGMAQLIYHTARDDGSCVSDFLDSGKRSSPRKRTSCV